MGYAFINFEDVSRRIEELISSTLIVEQPYSIIDVGALSYHWENRRLTCPQFVKARAGHRWCETFVDITK